VFDYLVFECEARKAAERLRYDVFEAMVLLETSPYMRSVSYKLELSKRGYREFFVGKYDIIYKIEGNEVYLLRFLHQSQDIESKV